MSISSDDSTTEDANKEDVSHPLEGSRKKAKLDDQNESSVRILTFCPDLDKNVKLQLLTSHTVYDLISTFCDNLTSGMQDNATAYNGKKYMNLVTLRVNHLIAHSRQN